MNQGANVLGKTTAAVTGAGKEELKANAGVVANAAANIVDVGAQPFTQVGHLIDEADLGGQHCIGDVLGHFRAFRRHDEEGPLGTQEGSVQLVQDLGDFLSADADNDAV